MRLPFVTVSALCLLGCGGPGSVDETRAGDVPPILVERIESPASAGSAEPEVTAGPDGLYLSWLEPTGGDRHALRFARLDARAWSTPRTVMERSDLFVNWADFPSVLALDDGTLAAHWLEKSGAGTYAYDVRTALSTDGGETWSQDVIPHRDGLEAEHGFVSLFPAVGGRVGAVWLDGRETVTGHPMTLRFATLGPEGASPEELLDASVCDCCQTSAAVAAGGPIVVYRDRTESEVRDIHIVRRVDGTWTDPAPIHEDGWVIDACPVNGPAVAASAERVAVAWFTGSPGPRVLVAFSDDAGATFGAPIRIDEDQAQGRVDLVLLDDGAALVSWLERTDTGAEILLRRATPEGAGPVLRLAGTSAERASGFPRMARLGSQVLFAWTEAGEAPRVRTAIGQIPAADGRPAPAAELEPGS